MISVKTFAWPFFLASCLSSVLQIAFAADTPLSPAALAASQDGRIVFIACETGRRVLRFDVAARKVISVFVTPGMPTGLALSSDAAELFVTCAGSASTVSILETTSGHVVGTLIAGHTAMAPVLSADGRSLFVCNRFDDDVSVLDLTTKRERSRIRVQREPVAAALTPDGRFLLVANLLHAGRADAAQVAAVVSAIDVAAGRVLKELTLPNGSGSLNGIAVSPDGRYALVTHLLSRFALPATQLERGWMNTNAGTIIDLTRMELLNTILLDSLDSGAANPWGVAWSSDSVRVVIAHAGTHEVSVIDFPALLARLAKLPAVPGSTVSTDGPIASRCRADVPNDLSFVVGLRQRIKLSPSDRGPRAVVLVGSTVLTANYFSDSLSAIDLAAPKLAAISIPLAPSQPMAPARKGELLFHDASICFQGWQSCASCHPGNARMDGLNWDLLNDGTGNPKNNKSLLLVHKTPPAMSLGVRESAELAVRAGIRHSLFTVQPPDVAESIDEYLKSLQPLPSPELVGGKLSPAAQRGQKVFTSAGCAECHPPGLFTDLNQYDVGTRGLFDGPAEQFDTPTLVETWRTAPYLHDGSAPTLRDVLTIRNRADRHGTTSRLSGQELDDLCAYLRSL